MKTKPTLHAFEIREGNGNDGEYYRIHVLAEDAFDALRLASRHGYLYKPRSVTLASADGDDQSAYLAQYHRCMEYCPWCASATLDAEETSAMVDQQFAKLRSY